MTLPMYSQAGDPRLDYWLGTAGGPARPARLMFGV